MRADGTAPPSLDARVAALRARVARACGLADRPTSSVLVVAVTKAHPAAVARAAVAHGLVDLGESRVQELTAKLDQVSGAHWHLVGRLQRNKAKDVVGRQVLVHSLDRAALADTLSRLAEQAGVIQRVLVQVNVGDDPAKAGCDVDETLDLVAYARELPNLVVEGLMTVPPQPPPDVDPGPATRPHFVALRGLRDQARLRWPEVVHLSMGQSLDLDVAVTEGATIVRVGTALFGQRDQDH